MNCLADFFAENPKVAVAFSGGVDSAYLLYEAGEYAEEVRAYYVKSAFQPQFELDDAVKFADQLGISMKVLELDILCNQEVKANPANRCYYCKKSIFQAILREAEKDGFSLLIDGTNASDDAGDRPGMKALAELEVRSPLRECGISKEELRKRSRDLGLFTWNKPAYACLATRIRTGQEIDLSLLEAIERAEDFMFSLGFSDFRVRIIGTEARIQCVEDQLSLLLANRSKILNRLKEDFQAVTLDLEVRH